MLTYRMSKKPSTEAPGATWGSRTSGVCSVGSLSPLQTWSSLCLSRECLAPGDRSLIALLCILTLSRHCICPQPASAEAPVSEWVLICLTGMLPGPVGEVLDLTKAVKPLISHNLRRPGWGIGRNGQKEESYLLT